MKESRPQSDTAATWFVVLRASRESGDRELEALARKELEGLGYRVTIRRPRLQEVSP